MILTTLYGEKFHFIHSPFYLFPPPSPFKYHLFTLYFCTSAYLVPTLGYFKMQPGMSLVLWSEISAWEDIKDINAFFHILKGGKCGTLILSEWGLCGEFLQARESETKIFDLQFLVFSVLYIRWSFIYFHTKNCFREISNYVMLFLKDEKKLNCDCIDPSKPINHSNIICNFELQVKGMHQPVLQRSCVIVFDCRAKYIAIFHIHVLQTTSLISTHTFSKVICLILID